MIRKFLFAATLVSLAGPAFAQQTVTYQCALDTRSNQVDIRATNPNAFDRVCGATCTYTNKEKATVTVACQGVPVNKSASKGFMCGDKAQGSAPYTNFRVTGKCEGGDNAKTDPKVQEILKKEEERKKEEARRLEELKKEEARKKEEAKKPEPKPEPLPVVNGKPLNYACVFDTSSKKLRILVTNPNGVNKKCDLSCSYEASDKKSDKMSCTGGVFKNADKQILCDNLARGPAPYTKLAVTGSCD